MSTANSKMEAPYMYVILQTQPDSLQLNAGANVIKKLPQLLYCLPVGLSIKGLLAKLFTVMRLPRFAGMLEAGWLLTEDAC